MYSFFRGILALFDLNPKLEAICSCCFLEQKTLPSLLSTGWFQERIRAWFQHQTNIS